MIVYHNIMKKLADAGYSSYRIAKEKLLPSSTLDRIRKNRPITTDTIDTICTLCECQPGDLISWEKDKQEK